ncbi:MAG: PhoH family protein [Proteobacteria bacterium]|nr:PhoH family protein [Pseudomonadota bacterium]MBU4295940.1 PhoH family protein [Pseudomonadota bacterium]MCG2746150.1 PhoH family protein [Desulfobulbaceae bacterium]
MLNTATQKQLSFTDNEAARLLYGDLNRNLLAIEKAVGVTVKARGTTLTISGPDHDVATTVATLNQLYDLIVTGYPIYAADVAYALRIMERSPQTSLKEIFLDQVYITAKHRIVSPKSINQKLYIDAIRNNDIAFGIGPAGTGKTYLAVAMAIAAYSANLVKSIILTRPAVEAGENLGFLPGDLVEKINPYLRPLHDALNDMLGRERAKELMEREIIEIAPLAFMRGRTLNNAFVILDEAQNTTPAQMKMFLTRLGFNSKAVITGDITQIDLPRDRGSGLIHAARILNKIKGISFSYFTDIDVVRHPLVQQIIRAYEKKEKSHLKKEKGDARPAQK